MKLRVKTIVALVLAGWLLTGSVVTAARVHAMPLQQVVAEIRDAGGHYVYGAASLTGADCSGIVSVAQSLAMGTPVRRLGDTRSLLAGNWPHAIRGATDADIFVIGASRSHMVARIDGIGIEATTSGRPFVVGPQAKSPWSMPTVWHIDPAVLI